MKEKISFGKKSGEYTLCPFIVGEMLILARFSVFLVNLRSSCMHEFKHIVNPEMSDEFLSLTR